LTEGGLRPF